MGPYKAEKVYPTVTARHWMVSDENGTRISEQAMTEQEAYRTEKMLNTAYAKGAAKHVKGLDYEQRVHISQLIGYAKSVDGADELNARWRASLLELAEKCDEDMKRWNGQADTPRRLMNDEEIKKSAFLVMPRHNNADEETFVSMLREEFIDGMKYARDHMDSLSLLLSAGEKLALASCVDLAEYAMKRWKGEMPKEKHALIAEAKTAHDRLLLQESMYTGLSAPPEYTKGERIEAITESLREVTRSTFEWRKVDIDAYPGIHEQHRENLKRLDRIVVDVLSRLHMYKHGVEIPESPEGTKLYGEFRAAGMDMYSFLMTRYKEGSVGHDLALAWCKVMDAEGKLLYEKSV